MCLPDFIKFQEISIDTPLIGYRNWKNPINTVNLKSESVDYLWLPNHKEIRHEITDKNSGIYAYNNNYINNNNNNYINNNNNNNNNNYYHYYYNYYHYYYYNNYNLGGIIHQWGKIAIHRVGYRSEYASIETLFTIRKSDAKGLIKFLNWIDEFNSHIEKIAKKYNVPNIISWQDFIENKSV